MKRSVHNERNVDIVTDLDGKKIVVIHDVILKGKRNIDWNAVEGYLWQFVGKSVEIEEYADKVYIGSVFPDEFSHSNDTESLRGPLAKAKANSAQGIPEMMRTATNIRFSPNYKQKHRRAAKNGWYRYDTRFAIPIYEDGVIQRYNVYRVVMIVNHASNGKEYLYDMVRVRKETSTPPKD